VQRLEYASALVVDKVDGPQIDDDGLVLLFGAILKLARVSPDQFPFEFVRDFFGAVLNRDLQHQLLDRV